MADLAFNEALHVYTIGGVVVPNVTAALDVVTDFSGIPAHVLDNKREIGKAVHLATELFDLGMLDEDSVDPLLEGYLDAYKSFITETSFIPTEIEQVVYNKRHNYAGTLDRVGIFPESDEVAIVDIKTTFNIMPTTGPQTAAYLEAYNYKKPKKDKATARYALQLKPTGAYVLKPCQDKKDFPVFLACLTIHTWRVQNNGK